MTASKKNRAAAGEPDKKPGTTTGGRSTASTRRRTNSAFARLGNLESSGRLKELDRTPSADATEPSTPAPADVSAPPAEPVQAPVAAPPAAASEEAAALHTPSAPAPQPVQSVPEPAPPAVAPEPVGAATHIPAGQGIPLQDAPRPESPASAPAGEPVQGPRSTTVVTGTSSRARGPAFPVTSGFRQPRSDALPTGLASRVQDLPVAYHFVAESYRAARATRSGSRSKRNIRLYPEVVQKLTRQLVADRKALKIRDLEKSHYVDAALSAARRVPVSRLIALAEDFRDERLGEPGGADSNHYSIRSEHSDWLDSTSDDMLLADAKGLLGYMINALVNGLLDQLTEEADGASPDR